MRAARKDLAAGLLVAAMLLVVGEARADSNPLLGKWHLTGGAVFPNHPAITCTVTDILFATTTQTVVTNGVTTSDEASYVYGGEKPPSKVFVIGSAGGANHLTYLFRGRDDIELDTALACKYHRVG